MRKAFDANVPKLKPRLRSAAVPAAVAEPIAKDDSLSPTGGEGRVKGQAPTAAPQPPLARAQVDFAQDGKSLSLTPTRALREGEGRSPRDGASRAEPPAEGSFDSRRDRLEKIKRRVAEAARPRTASPAGPVDPARAAESVLGLVRDLEGDLGRAREREEALRADLESSRAEATRAGAEARGAVERLAAVEAQLEEKRSVLSDLLAEMGALEAERDEAIRRTQGLSSLDEERARLLEELARRADEESRLRGEREAEVERLSEELRAGAADGARLRGALAQLARERDDAAGELERVRRERDELASAKRALEQVHTALAQARARLG
jgi:DNA repair exonuclease SbcCD ATPase subunit